MKSMIGGEYKNLKMQITTLKKLEKYVFTGNLAGMILTRNSSLDHNLLEIFCVPLYANYLSDLYDLMIIFGFRESQKHVNPSKSLLQKFDQKHHFLCHTWVSGSKKAAVKKLRDPFF